MSQFIVIAPYQTSVLNLYHKIFIIKTELEYHKRCLHNLGILHDQLERWIRAVKKILFDIIFKDDNQEEAILIADIWKHMDLVVFSNYFDSENFKLISIEKITGLALLDCKSRETFWSSVSGCDNTEEWETGNNVIMLNLRATMQYYCFPIMKLSGVPDIESSYIQKRGFDRRCLELCDFFVSCETKTISQIQEVINRLEHEFKQAEQDNGLTKSNIKHVYNQITVQLESFIRLHDLVQTQGLLLNRMDLMEYLKGDKDRQIYLYPAHKKRKLWNDEIKLDEEKRASLYKNRTSNYEKEDLFPLKHTDKTCDPYTPCYKCWSIPQSLHFSKNDFIFEPPDNIMIFNRKGYFSGFLLSSIDSENNKFTTLAS